MAWLKQVYSGRRGLMMTTTFMRKCLIVGLIGTLVLMGCLRQRPPAEMYQLTMRMAAPSTVWGMEYGTLNDGITMVYLIYQATPAYFEFLGQNDDYLQRDVSLIQHRIEPVSCTQGDVHRIFVKLVAEVSDFTDKRCYQGVVGLDIHYIVYDPRAERVYHVIDWVRD